MTVPDVVAPHAVAARSVRSEVDERSLDMSGRLLKVDGMEAQLWNGSIADPR
jgi:hypothetical protein